MKKAFLIVLILLIKFSHLHGQSTFSERKITNLNQNWFYLEDNNPKLSEIQTSNSWIPITLPHSWNSFDATDITPGYRRDGSWYKKNLEIENLEASKRYVLYFEGANITTKVYVNNQFAGEHVGGYLGFDIEITKFLKLQGKNEVLVRVDNAYNREIIPSQKADFFIFGGITEMFGSKPAQKSTSKRCI